MVLIDVAMIGGKYLQWVERARGYGLVVVWVAERDFAVVQALFPASVKEKVVGLGAKEVMEGYTGEMGRIATSAQVSMARKKGWDEWEEVRRIRARLMRGRRTRPGNEGETAEVDGGVILVVGCVVWTAMEVLHSP